MNPPLVRVRVNLLLGSCSSFEGRADADGPRGPAPRGVCVWDDLREKVTAEVKAYRGLLRCVSHV